MIKSIIKSAVFAIAAGLAVLPALSQAATNQSQVPVRATYQASLQPITQLEAPWTGTLQLTINPNGIIQGYYHPADQMAFIPVTGGQDGNSVWLDIGTMGRLHVNGTLHNGTIAGSAVDERTNETYSFTARAQS
jgi:hypothetical protein